MYKLIEGISMEQPREKAVEYGVKKLSDRELISILLGSGSKDIPVGVLAAKVLDFIDRNKGDLQLDALCQIKGVGIAKGTMLLSALEFSRRVLCPTKRKITYPTDILPIVRHYVTRAQEYFLVISLNGAHEVIKTEIISIGILNKTLIHPREVFTDAIGDKAASIIISHNHPSGDLTPSREDIEVTKRLVKAGEILGISILDHVIFSDIDYYSFTENALI